MIDIVVDASGNLHCGKCGSTQFIAKRTFASKVALGVGSLLTHKKLKCLACGTYNQTGRAKTPTETKPPKPQVVLSADKNADNLARIRAQLAAERKARK